jgi:hypothetical protein
MRKINWKPDLLGAIDGAREEQFEYGVMDCATFVANCVHAMTGTDPMKDLRGQYHSAQEALAACAAMGHAQPVDYLASLFKEIEPAMAQTGDIAMVTSDIPDWPAMGVFSGPRIMVMRPDGLGSLPRTDALRAFKVD